MATVWIPALLRPLTAGRDSVELSGATLGTLIDALEAQHPGVRARLVEGDALRPGIAAVIDGQVSREGLTAHVASNSEVHFIAAVGGG
jgi:molybdopterin converting factor small subunit